MNEEIKKLWCQALRSGEYARGSYYLCQEWSDGPRWCPLGVLLDVAYDGEWIIEPGESFWRIDNRYGLLPLGFSDDIGLSHRDQCLLSDFVDRNQWASFDVIAGWIEAHL